jgi:hypothetical protein
MARAKTPWIFEKPNRDGICVGWYDVLGKRHNKKFANKSLANQHIARLTLELNGESRRRSHGALPNADSKKPAGGWSCDEKLLPESRDSDIIRSGPASYMKCEECYKLLHGEKTP